MTVSLSALVDVSREVGATASRLGKIGALSTFLKQLEPGEIEIAVAYLSGDTGQNRLGIGPGALYRLAASPAGQPSLTLKQVDQSLGQVRTAKGKGSAAGRAELLHHLFGRATGDEQDFLLRLLTGELRQGALEGVMLEALARAADVPIEAVRRAAMYGGTLPRVARAALTAGEQGLSEFSLRVLQPLQPMLADTADDVAEALGRFGAAALEWKLDGARVQVHKAGATVKVFSRSLNDVTAAVPEVVETVAALPARDIVLDGETIALHPDGRPHPFQVTMRRFGRKLDVDGLRRSLPLSVFFFDCLHLDGDTLTGRPARERFASLSGAVPSRLSVPRLITADVDAARQFYDEALRQGHEGVMAKALDAPYEAGRRGASWLKIKRVQTLDLVVLGAEWGNGRRRGWLSNLHLGARDPGGGFVMLGKTFKGMTDELLQWQTRELLAREERREGHIVYVRPELVVEIAFNDLQSSPQYPGGLALRFARLKGYRPDKKAEEADTIDAVRALHRAQSAREALP